jgi:hypothetical protein
VSARAPVDPTRRARERGEALIFAVFVLLLLGVSLALLALSMRVRLEEQQREVRRARLDLLLDGVMAETLARLALDPRFSGVASRREGDGEASTAVDRYRPELARIEAEARLGGRSVGGRALVQILPGPPRVLQWQRDPGSW